MTALELHQQADIGTAVTVYGNLAGQVSQTDFVPRAFKGRPEAILACMLYGREIGLGPMQSLKLIDSIQGTPTLKPEAMRALVRKAGHRIWTEENTDTAVTVCGWRREDPAEVVERVRWTMDDANRAKLTSKDSWKNYPRAMLLARATAELCRLHFADVIGGLSYTPEEAEDFAEPVTPVRHVDPEPKPALTAGPTRARKPPTVPDGMVSVAEAKQRLLDVYLEQGIVPADAKNYAKVHWGVVSGYDDKRSEPLTVAEVDALIADARSLLDEPTFDAEVVEGGDEQ